MVLHWTCHHQLLYWCATTKTWTRTLANKILNHRIIWSWRAHTTHIWRSKHVCTNTYLSNPLKYANYYRFPLSIYKLPVAMTMVYNWKIKTVSLPYMSTNNNGLMRGEQKLYIILLFMMMEIICTDHGPSCVSVAVKEMINYTIVCCPLLSTRMNKHGRLFLKLGWCVSDIIFQFLFYIICFKRAR